MAEKKAQKTKVQSDYLSDSESSEEEVNPYLRTSEEERIYGTIKGSTQATQTSIAEMHQKQEMATSLHTTPLTR